MIIKFYNIEPHIIVRWIILFLIKNNIIIDNWIDLGGGDGSFISKINIIPNNGFLIDIVNNIKNLPKNFIFVKKPVKEYVDFINNNFNKITLITAFELVEHLEKKDALEIIDKCSKIGDNFIISTPSGFLKQDQETHPEHKDNPYQWHRCGFEVKELENLGFFVIILKNYHFRIFNYKKEFYDALIAFKSKNNNYKILKFYLIFKLVIYYLNIFKFLKLIKYFIRYFYLKYVY